MWKIDPAIEELARLRPLTTSYTPYQPERSQGTLQTHWIYQCALSALTGFEAINTSLYDRSFAIYESILCAIRTSKRPSKALLSKSLFENDIQVLETLAEGTGLEFSFVDINPENGKIAVCFIDGEFTVKRIKKEKDRLYLMSENKKYKHIEIKEENELIIWGMVEYVIKKV